MTPDQLTKLTDGDIIRNTAGNAYTVLRNIGVLVIATRTLGITNAAEWEHVYTTTPVKEDFKPSPTPAGLSRVQVVTELKRLGWKFDNGNGEWTSPNGSCKTRHILTAWGQRHDFPKRACPDYNAAATELKRLGWTRVSDNKWTSPGGCVHTMLSAWQHRHDFKPSPEPALVHMVKELQTLGWMFNENIDFWTSPDGKFQTNSLRHAWKSRNNYPAKYVNTLSALACPKTAPYRCPTVEETVEELQKLKSKVKSFPEAQEALRNAGWVNVAGRVWRAPSGCFVDGTRCAYESMSAGFHNAS